MKTVLIGGGSGLIGQRLSELLSVRGYEVLHLSRTKDPSSQFSTYVWDVANGTIDAAAIKKADIAINLAGEGIADGRWTEKRKKRIIDSRVKSSLLLMEGFKKIGKKPDAFISAAAAGYYGDRGEKILTESSAPGKEGFLPESCRVWEEAIHEVEKTGWRVAWLRQGIILSNKGGALEKFELPLKVRMAGIFGSGEQWYSWIHIDDVCRVYIHLIENTEAGGAYNAVAPEPVRNREFVNEMIKIRGRRIFKVAIPEFALRLALGEMADTILSSARLSSEKLQQEGFNFLFPGLRSALMDLKQYKD